MPATSLYGDRKDRTQLHTHIPATMYDALTERARNNHRSLTREVIAIVEEVLRRDEKTTQ